MKKSSLKWPNRYNDYNLDEWSKLLIIYFKAELLNLFKLDL